MGYRTYIYAAVLSVAWLLPAPSHAQSEEISFTPPPPAPVAAQNWDASPFSLKYADGRSVSSDELKGKMVFIDAWATWCAPCMPSLPKFSELYRKNIGNPHVKVLSVHLSDRYGRFDSAAEFLASKQLYYPVIQDPDGELTNRFGGPAGGFSVPHYVLLDGDGKVLRRYGEINDLVIRDVQGRFNAHSRDMRNK